MKPERCKQRETWSTSLSTQAMMYLKNMAHRPYLGVILPAFCGC